MTGPLRGLTWEGWGPASLSVPGRLLGPATSAGCHGLGSPSLLDTYLPGQPRVRGPFTEHEWLEGCPQQSWGRLPVKFSVWAVAAAQGLLATAATWALLPGGGQRRALPDAGALSACASALGPERPALWEAAVAAEQEAPGERPAARAPVSSPTRGSQGAGMPQACPALLRRALPDPWCGVGAWGWAGHTGPIAPCRACRGGPRGLSQLPSHSLHQSGASGRGCLGHPAPGAAPRAAPGWYCVFGERARQQPRTAEVSQRPCEGPELPCPCPSQHPNPKTPALQH